MSSLSELLKCILSYYQSSPLTQSVLVKLLPGWQYTALGKDKENTTNTTHSHYTYPKQKLAFPRGVLQITQFVCILQKPMS